VPTLVSTIAWCLANRNKSLVRHQPVVKGYKIGTKAFNDCMVSSWNNLTNTLGWAILCSLEPVSCIAACVIHCSVSGITVQMTREQALKWLCDNGMIDCNGVYHDNNYTFISL